MYDLCRLRPEQTNLYLLSFAWLRYRQLTDNLVDALAYHMKQLEKESSTTAKRFFVTEQLRRQQETPRVGRLLSLYVDTDDVVREFAATKHVAAICAAPFILGELDLLEGRHATCFPGFEKSFPEGAYTGEKVTQDGNIITASGMAQSLPFALELLRTLAGDKAVEKVAEGIQL